MIQKIFDPNELPFKVKFSTHYVPNVNMREQHAFFSYEVFLEALKKESNSIVKFILENWIPTGARIIEQIEYFDGGEITHYEDGSISIDIGFELTKDDNPGPTYYEASFYIKDDTVIVSSGCLMWPFKMGKFYNEEIE